ncbi:MAG: hypothetical protein M1815_001919 [Lichina confinis]|nr:MAG: hypothetical protein M1815_001919 [Lichina confinis]
MSRYHDVEDDVDLEDAFLLASAPPSGDENGSERPTEQCAPAVVSAACREWLDQVETGPSGSQLMTSPPHSSDDEATHGRPKATSPIPIPARRKHDTPWWESEIWKNFQKLTESKRKNTHTTETTAHLPSAMTVHDAENMADTENRPPSLGSTFIGGSASNVFPDMRPASHVSGSADSDLVNSIIDSYLTPRTPSDGGGSEMPNLWTTGANQETARTEPVAPVPSRGDGGQSAAETPLRRTINDVVAVRQLATRGVESVGTPGEAMPGTGVDIGPLIHQLERIAIHNESRPSTGTEPEEGLSDSAVTRFQVKKRLQEDWQRTYKPALAAQLARLDAQRLEEELQQRSSADAASTRDPGTRLARRRRSMTRQAIRDLMRSQLTEVESGLQGTLSGPVGELKELHLIDSAQRYMVMRSFLKTHDVLSSVLAEQEEMRDKTCGAEIPLMKTKLAALAGVLETSINACSQLETRIGRLSAKDVPAGIERDAVSKRRLDQPEALTYVDRAEQDVAFIKANARAVLAAMHDIETDLDGIARGGNRLLQGYDDAMGFVVGELPDDA